MGIHGAERVLTPIGFTFFLVALIFLSWPSPFEVISFSESHTTIVRIYSSTQIVVSAFIFMCWAVNAWFRPVAKRLVYSTTGAVIAIAGLFCLVVAVSYPTLAETFALLAAIALGGGLTSCFVSWIRIFATQDFFYSSTRIVFSVVSAALIYFTLQMLPVRIAWICIVVLTVVSCILAPVCINARPFDQEAFNHSPRANRDRYIKQSKTLWRPILYALACAFIWGLLRAYAAHAQIIEDSNRYLALGMLLAAVTLTLTWTVFSNRYGFIRIFRWLSLLLVSFLLVFSLFRQPFFAFLSALSSFSFILAWMLMLLICCRDAEGKNTHPFIAWGTFAMAYTVAYGIFGYFLGWQLAVFCAGFFDTSAESVIAIFAIYIVFLVSFIDRRGKNSEVVAKNENARNSIQDMMIERCAAISEEYGLSPREQDVLTILARGRDVYYISQKLFISVSTVQFHCKNIYKKLEIHSKQELISLVVEDAQREKEH